MKKKAGQIVSSVIAVLLVIVFVLAMVGRGVFGNWNIAGWAMSITGNASKPKPEGPSEPEDPVEMSDGLTFAVNSLETGYVVTGLVDDYQSEELMDLIIPAYVDDWPVLEIDEYAFSHNEEIRSVKIPETVTAIGDSAFTCCASLESVDLGGVITIGKLAFEDCEALETVNFSENLIEIGNSAFYECSSLKEVVIPDSVTTIGYNAFEHSGIQSLTIGKSVNSIFYEAFLYCPLETVNYNATACSFLGNGNESWYGGVKPAFIVGANVQSIPPFAFNATSITFENPNGWYCTADSTFSLGTAVDVTDPDENARNYKGWSYAGVSYGDGEHGFYMFRSDEIIPEPKPGITELYLSAYNLVFGKDVTTQTLTVDYEPEDAEDFELIWEASSGLTVTPSEDGLSATVECTQAFGTRQTVSVRASDNSEAYTMCMCDYVKDVTTVIPSCSTIKFSSTATNTYTVNVLPATYGIGTVTPTFAITSGTLASSFTVTISGTKEVNGSVYSMKRSSSNKSFTGDSFSVSRPYMALSTYTSVKKFDGGGQIMMNCKPGLGIAAPLAFGGGVVEPSDYPTQFDLNFKNKCMNTKSDGTLTIKCSWSYNGVVFGTLTTSTGVAFDCSAV